MYNKQLTKGLYEYTKKIAKTKFSLYKHHLVAIRTDGPATLRPPPRGGVYTSGGGGCLTLSAPARLSC